MSPIVATVYEFYPLNTNVAEADGLQDEISLAYFNSATVTGTLIDEFGNPDPVFNGIPMAYQPGTNGNYIGIVPATFNAPLGSGYTFVIKAVQGQVQGLWSEPARVKLRTDR